jgi:hypothetical protein
MQAPDPYAGARAAFRIPVEATKTYQILRPRDTHSRPATCAEVDCQHRRGGWVTVADERTDQGRLVASHVRRLGRPVGKPLAPAVAARVRRYVEQHADGVTQFVFPPGQECFEPHRVTIERPALYVVRDGDYRGNPRGTAPIHHANGADWVEDSALHQQSLVEAHRKG